MAAPMLDPKLLLSLACPPVVHQKLSLSRFRRTGLRQQEEKDFVARINVGR